jgi:hypothetical protein
MGHEYPYRVRIVGIDVIDLLLAQKIGSQQISFAAMPLGTDTFDAVHDAER